MEPEQRVTTGIRTWTTPQRATVRRSFENYPDGHLQSCTFFESWIWTAGGRHGLSSEFLVPNLLSWKIMTDEMPETAKLIERINKVRDDAHRNFRTEIRPFAKQLQEIDRKTSVIFASLAKKNGTADITAINAFQMAAHGRRRWILWFSQQCT